MTAIYFVIKQIGVLDLFIAYVGFRIAWRVFKLVF